MAKKTKKIQVKAAKATINKKNQDGSTDTIQEEVGESRMFDEPPCNVGYMAGLTLALPDYENVKYTVSLHVPCEHDEIDDTYDFIEEWVDDRVMALKDDFDNQ